MGLFNQMSNSLNRGVNTVNRSGKTAQLNLQLKNLMNQRRGLAAQLGASLYEATRHNTQFTVGREPLYDGIANIDAQRAAIEAQIEQIKAEQAAQTAATYTYRCPNCGSVVAATDLFCMGCGLPIAQVIAGQQGAAASAAPVVQTASGRACPNCGAPLAGDDVFCMNCGVRVDGERSSAPTSAPTSDASSAPSQVPTFVETPAPSPAPASSALTSASDSAWTHDPTSWTDSAATPAQASGPTHVIDVPDPVISPAATPAPSSEQAELTCPNCGAEVAQGEKFCFACGHKLA